MCHVIVMRHTVCHFEFINFNDLSVVATHNDIDQRHNLCHFLDKTTQPMTIFENVFSKSCSIAIKNYYINFTFLSWSTI